MSAGAFSLTRYEADDVADIYPIRVQPETLALVVNGVTNTPPTDPANQAVSARARGARRSFGS